MWRGRRRPRRVRLAWEPSCRPGDNDYIVYEAPIDDPLGLFPVTCSTVQRLYHEFTPTSESAGFLVVPTDGTTEGSYGRASDGIERWPASAACHPQALGDPICP